jgi:hypothetical protein
MPETGLDVKLSSGDVKSSLRNCKNVIAPIAAESTTEPLSGVAELIASVQKSGARIISGATLFDCRFTVYEIP